MWNFLYGLKKHKAWLIVRALEASGSSLEILSSLNAHYHFKTFFIAWALAL
jgi:hypothetical protein